MTVIIFIVILAVLVFVHELGHFLVAKASGIRVDEFSIGFPPRLVSFRKGETLYSLNLIPFGGYVKIFGEDPTQEMLENHADQKCFINKPKYIQALVLAAGIGFNIIFAWLLISLGFMVGMAVPQGYSGSTDVKNIELTITAVSKDSPAERAGLKAGDNILNLKSGTDTLTQRSPEGVSDFMSSHANKEVQIEFMRGAENKITKATPVYNNGADRAVIGIMPEMFGTLKLSFFPALWEGGKLTVYLVESTAVGLGQFFSQIFVGKANLSEVTGPVGIANLVGDAAKLGFSYIISFTAVISINLAIINLLPFPALDGGRLVVVAIEKIKGSRLNSKVVNTVNLVGFCLLILLMVVVTFHDVLGLFVK